MSGGGKGGSTTSQVTIPAWLESAARQNLSRADQLAQIGYTPYYGPDVAAFTPMQQAAFEGTNQAAAAFGMPTAQGTGMPAPQTFAGGVQGYSSAPMYQQAVDALAAARPGQYAALNAPFIDPVTGAAPASPFGSGGAQMMPNTPMNAAQRVMTGGGGGGTYVPVTSSTGRADRDQQGFGQTSSGYTSLADMFNGGGPGASGSTFQGGPISGALNTVGVRPAGSGGSSSGMGSRK